MKRFLLIVVILFMACAQRENKPLANVGSEVITVGQLEKGFPKTLSSKEQADQYKQRQLENLINRKLFWLEGKSLGLDKSQTTTDQYELRKKDVLLRALYDQVVVKRAQVSSAEIRNGYKLMGEEVQLKIILLDTKEEADRIVDELDKGVAFETLAVKYSRHASAQRGGDLSYGTLFDLDEALKKPVMALKPNQSSSPIKVTGGFAVVKLYERRKKELGDFKKESPRIKATILQRKQYDLTRKFMEGLSARLSYNQHGLDLLTTRIDSLTPADREIWVAKKGNEFIKVANLIPVVRRMPGYLTPPIKIYGIKREIESDLLFEEATHRRLEKDKKVKEDLQQLLEDIVYATLNQTEVIARSVATDSQIALYFNDHKTDYAGKTLDEVKGAIKGRLEMELRAQRLQEFIQELKAKYPVTIDTNLLASIQPTIKPKEKK